MNQGRQTFFFENGVTSNVEGVSEPPAKSLKTVQAKQCTTKKTGFSKKKSTMLPTKYGAFFVENTGTEPLTSEEANQFPDTSR